MSQRHHFRAGDKLMVHYLIHGLLRIIMVGKYHAGTAVAEQRIVRCTLVVDLVEGHPVFHFVLIAAQDHLAETHKEVDHFRFSQPPYCFTSATAFQSGKG